ncbi:hypothetical protein [Mediterraneibacter agrestimuris]|uniref:hypothetical protein n=1 Tax=Mediterraneibacter agrestimuris TaxID=2941333 RepID=UPI0038CC1CCA
METYDCSGKTVIPFAMSGGSARKPFGQCFLALRFFLFMFFLSEYCKKNKYRNGGSENQSCRFIGTWKCVCCTTAFFFCRRAAD